MAKAYNLLYRVTNIQTSKEYVGIHSTNQVEDGYMGSGVLLKMDIKEFGVASFKREIIEFFENRELLLLAEREIVNEQYLASSNTYNLILGGGGVKMLTGRRIGEKPIYNKKANEAEILSKKFKKHNEAYQYIFDFSKAQIKAPEYEMGAMRKAIMNILVENWAKVEYDVTLLWNNSYTNLVAKKFMLKLLQYKGIAGNIWLDIFDWEGNFVSRNHLILE
jgi:hypothetical protein